MFLTRRPVTTLRQALQVGRLRNTCCEYMTNCRERIGVLQQTSWYYRTYLRASGANEYRIFLFYDEAAVAVGYGALQLRDGKLYITECVDTKYRGRGYGREILAALIEIGQQERRLLVAEIWTSNQKSTRLHVAAGFLLDSVRMEAGVEIGVYRLTNSFTSVEKLEKQGTVFQ